MDKNSRDPIHCWLVLMKAFHATAKYLYAGLEETGIDETDFRVLEVLLNKGPLPVNTIGPKVNLTRSTYMISPPWQRGRPSLMGPTTWFRTEPW